MARDLAALSTAIEGKYFEHHFHFAGGTFVFGSPLFPPLGEFAASQRSTTLAQILGELRRLTDEQRQTLRTLLQEYYWESGWIVNNQQAIGFLFETGILKKSWITEFAVGDWHDAVRYAYRYGEL